MRTQYTRVYIDVDTGEVAHVHTQDTPLDFDPVEDLSRNLIHEDMELDLNADHHVHAADIREGLSYENGEVVMKPLARSALVAAAAIYTKERPRAMPTPRGAPDLFEDKPQP